VHSRGDRERACSDVPPARVIVVDNGSTDATGDIIQSFGHAVVYTRQSNAGNGAAPDTTRMKRPII